jgi:hypothetical protein
MPRWRVNPTYSIHRVQHTLCAAGTVYCIIPISTVSRSQPVSQHTVDYVVCNSLDSELPNKLSLSSRRASLLNNRLQIDHLHVHLQSRSIMASKCVSELAQPQPPSISLNSHDYRVKVCTITASKCITKLAWSQTRSASRNLLEQAPMCISKLARSQVPSLSPNLLNCGLQTHLNAASKCSFEFTRSQCGEMGE